MLDVWLKATLRQLQQFDREADAAQRHDQKPSDEPETWEEAAHRMVQSWNAAADAD